MAFRKRPYFEGWYFKHQMNNHIISIIPGRQQDTDGSSTAFIQIITEDESYFITYPKEVFQANRKKFRIQIDANIFSEHGVILSIHEQGLDLEGTIEYEPFTPIRYSIMGPFNMIPFLQCRHEIISMGHEMKGWIRMNGQEYHLDHGRAYIEGDYGDTFPQTYFWSQSNCFKDKSAAVFAAAADLRILWWKLRGCIAIIQYHGKEYRLATYCGGKVLELKKDHILIQQGRKRLWVEVNPAAGQELRAPVNGAMSARIKECVTIPTKYRFYKGSKLVFEGETNWGSHEYVSQLQQKNGAPLI